MPGLLVAAPPPGMEPHVGTADLDLHLSLHLLDGETADYYQAIIDGPADEVRTQLTLLIDDQFRDEASVGPASYASFLEASSPDLARRHALGTVDAFRRALAARGVEL